MRRGGVLRAAAAAAALALAAGPASAFTLDEVLARHERARGGKGRWEAVRSLTLKGEQETFSLVSPFTLIRAQPARMRWEYDALGKPTDDDELLTGPQAYAWHVEQVQSSLGALNDHAAADGLLRSVGAAAQPLDGARLVDAGVDAVGRLAALDPFWR